MSFPKERNWKSEQNAAQTMPILNNYSFMQISMYVQGSFTVSKQLVCRGFLIKLYSHKTGPKSKKQNLQAVGKDQRDIRHPGIAVCNKCPCSIKICCARSINCQRLLWKTLALIALVKDIF